MNTSINKPINIHERMIKSAERILQLLELPYRIILLSSAETGDSSKITYDIEDIIR